MGWMGRCSLIQGRGAWPPGHPPRPARRVFGRSRQPRLPFGRILQRKQHPEMTWPAVLAAKPGQRVPPQTGTAPQALVGGRGLFFLSPKSDPSCSGRRASCGPQLRAERPGTWTRSVRRRGGESARCARAERQEADGRAFGAPGPRWTRTRPSGLEGLVGKGSRSLRLLGS